MSTENSQELDSLDEELNGLDLGNDEEFESRPRRAGRPKGSSKRNSPKLDSINDPFEFAEAYLTEFPTEPIKMVIRRGGALLTIIDYSDDRSAIKIKSLAQVQDQLGAGQFSFEIVSLKSGRPVREPFTEIILSRPNLTATIKEQAPKAETTISSEEKFIQMLGLLQKQSGESQQVNQNLPQQPTSLVDQLVKLAPAIPLIMEGFKALRGPEKPSMSPEEMMLKFQEMARKEREEEKARQEEIDEEVERRLELERERRGLAPEKSFIEQVVEGLGSVTKVVQANAKVKELEVKARRTQPQTPVKRIAQKPQVLPARKENSDDLRLVVEKLLVKGQELGGDESKIAEFVKSDAECMAVIQKYDVDTICKETHKVLGLTEEVSAIREGIEKLYANSRLA